MAVSAARQLGRRRGSSRQQPAVTGAVRLYRRCLKSALRCPDAGHRRSMFQYVQLGFRSNLALVDDRHIRNKISDAQTQLEDMERLHNDREVRQQHQVATASSPATKKDSSCDGLGSSFEPGGREWGTVAVLHWSADDVCKWLVQLPPAAGVTDDVVALFRRHDVDGVLLGELDHEDLAELGVVGSRLTRKKLLSEISKLLHAENTS